MTMAATRDKLLRRLQSMVRGRILTAEDEEYDDARRIYNGLLERRPAFIVRCEGIEDVQAAVRFSADRRCPPAVRGGGHSAAGFAMCEGGLVIDLSRMKGVQVDPLRRLARARAGVTWGEFDAATQAFGLATTGARISSTGVAGVTLGGGYGWLMRKHGLAVDNLVSAEIVAADGQVLKASADENPDLFWGIRGGGGNFGIAVSLEFRLHPLTQVTGGMAFYPAERGLEVLQFYRDWTIDAPDEFSALCNFLIMPEAPFVPPHLQGVPVVAIALCHCGTIADAQRDLGALAELGPPLMERIRPMPYTKLQRMYDAAGEFGHKVYGRSGHLPELTDHVFETIAAHARRITSPLSIAMLCRLGGAVARIPDDVTAFSRRQSAFDLSINAVWSDASENSIHTSWTEEFWDAVRPFCAGVYVNELGQEGEDRVREAYTPQTLQRLAALKKIYDPDNLFRLNHNIPPGA